MIMDAMMMMMMIMIMIDDEIMIDDYDDYD